VPQIEPFGSIGTAFTLPKKIKMARGRSRFSEVSNRSGHSACSGRRGDRPVWKTYASTGCH
ncbi:MAG TPA: hypothetical protein VEP90_17955, partial [Methylomirabilota bacterium]|nr:hypothetical protein [Methylomirabilota bacterium]